LRILILAGFAAFPLFLYLLREHLSAAALIGLFAALAGARLLLASQLRAGWRLALLALLAAFTAIALNSHGLQVLMVYPVLFSLAASAWCAWTLRHPPSAIERLARLSGMPVDAAGERYTRGVTWLWLGFFLINAGIAAWTAWHGDTALWSLYNGLASYLLVALLFAGEWLFRGFYRRRLAARQ
jgi:uncharacterized membrane protein